FEKAILIKWIEQGAVYKPHWAYIQPQKTEPPAVTESGWIVNEIDQFVLNNLESKGLTPAPQASSEILLRRVTFDLTGLPPTLEELDQFMKDQSPDAYGRAADRAVAADRYGEKMARAWMDLSRFADTHGYTVDRFRPMWRWRDWVIQSFTENMPYHQFVTWQLAG